MIETDVLIIGGGPAGSAVAATLCRSGIDVVVIDATSAQDNSFRVGEGAPPATASTIDSIFGRDSGAFDRAAHLPSYANRSAWGSEALIDTDFMFNPFGHAWHLDRVAFDRALLDAAESMGARVYRGNAVDGVVRRGDGWQVTIGCAGAAPTAPRNRRTVRANFACDASGRRALLARGVGQQRVLSADHLVAVVAVVEPSADEAANAATAAVAANAAVAALSATTVEAVADGWWYTAPVPDSRRVVVMFSDGDLIDPGRMRTWTGFRHALRGTSHISSIVSPVGSDLDDLGAGCRPPWLTSAATSRLECTVGPGWLAVGDAAAAFDPLSSQGIVSALVMGAQAGKAITEMSAVVSTGPSKVSAALDAYSASYESLIEQYRTEHRTIYALERRWPKSTFWSRRHHAA